jgi:hypothetical protein
VQELAAPSEYLPAGHKAAVADVDPAGQAYPAVQGPVQDDAVRPPMFPYLPAVHCPLQDAVVVADDDPYSPAAQSVQVPAPAREYWPAAHVTAVAEVDPTGHAYPAVHCPLHDDVGRPWADPKEPAGHWMHDAAPARAYVPAAQMEAVALEEPAGQEYPALQLPEQAEDVMAAVEPNRPAAQSVQVPDEAELHWPAAHVTAVAEVDPAGQANPAVQGPVQEDTLRPVELPKRPAGHWAVQVLLVMADAAPYVPAGHGVQDPAPAKEYWPAGHRAAVGDVDPAAQA